MTRRLSVLAALLLAIGIGHRLTRRTVAAAPAHDRPSAARTDEEPIRGGIGMIDARPRDDDEEVEADSGDGAGDSPEEDDGERPRPRGRRIVGFDRSVRAGHVVYDFEDDVVYGNVPDEWDYCDEGDCDDEPEPRDTAPAPWANPGSGPASWCANNLLCVIASATGGGPAPSLPGALGAAYRRAREDFRAGRFRAAAAGFVFTATGAPALANRTAADRDLICQQAAAALLAAASDDGARPPEPPTGEPTVLASLGPCAPQFRRLLGPAGSLPTSSIATQLPGDPAPPPDTTHL